MSTTIATYGVLALGGAMPLAMPGRLASPAVCADRAPMVVALPALPDDALDLFPDLGANANIAPIQQT